MRFLFPLFLLLAPLYSLVAFADAKDDYEEQLKKDNVQALYCEKVVAHLKKLPIYESASGMISWGDRIKVYDIDKRVLYEGGFINSYVATFFKETRFSGDARTFSGDVKSFCKFNRDNGIRETEETHLGSTGEDTLIILENNGKTLCVYVSHKDGSRPARYCSQKVYNGL